MGRLFLILASVVSIFCASSGFSEVCQNLLQNQRTYVAPEQLNISSQGIFLNVGNQCFQAEAIFSDENGIYVQNLSPQEDGCRKGFVPCRNCDRCVAYYYDICPHCNKPV